MTPSIEKTPIGMQYVIPGAERVVNIQGVLCG